MSTPSPAIPDPLSDWLSTLTWLISVQEKLGEGGFGAVYLVHVIDLKTEEKSLEAVKILTNNSNPSRMKRFNREISMMSRMNHENVVPILRIFHSSNRYPWYSMPYYEKKSIHSYMKEVGNGRTIRTSFANNYILTAARALHYAQRCHKILHRDVSLGNLIMDDQSVLVVSDWGLALDQDASIMTGDNVRMGTAMYIAPEITGSHQHTVASDIYSLGICLREMRGGLTKFAGYFERCPDEAIVELQAKMAAILPENRFKDWQEVLHWIMTKSMRPRAPPAGVNMILSPHPIVNANAIQPNPPPPVAAVIQQATVIPQQEEMDDLTKILLGIGVVAGGVGLGIGLTQLFKDDD
ncbi:MAG: hypothetical protein Sylvanvirus7_39 [Sylvanvirus sp.]|uniref:Protein kinase domain-containing protein n=1 Tax=Sylvanvirus sp. TaxID=2487774 RepID=A0A3G5AJP1_9VIRU|nr:MAG: hypothetical protein Sylvanvirus7_39 [Sylvanvirus sp.]